MQVRMVKAFVWVALALVLNHARCVAACTASPCAATPQPNCHHHKSTESPADRGCAIPAANDSQSPAGIAIYPDAVTTPELFAGAPVPGVEEVMAVKTDPRGSPPGADSISILRI